jgi:hypothetical protein
MKRNDDKTPQQTKSASNDSKTIRVRTGTKAGPMHFTWPCGLD